MKVMTRAELKCTKCGSITPIQRNRGYRKEKGHTKHLWCFKCKETTAQEELDARH